MFGFLKNNRSTPDLEPKTQVGCFGKLPIYDEFIRYNVNGRRVLELDEWIQQGFSHHSRGAATRPEKTDLHDYVYHFVFTGSGDHRSSVIGTLMGSRDKSGRQYPFVIFKLLPARDTEALTSALPCAYGPFFDSARSLCATDWSLQPINMLKKRVAALNEGGATISRSRLIEAEVDALQALSKERFWRDMLADSAEEKVPHYLEAMRDLLETVARKSPLRTSWGIEIPLPGNDHSSAHVAFWVGAAESLLGSRGWRPHFIWGDVKDSGGQSLYLFFRPVTPIFFSHLLGHRADNGILINLDQECNEQSQYSEMAGKIGSLDANEHMVSAFDEWSNWRHV